ncbi:odorant receptor 131-2-like [Hippocampus zosterae]|uniref:odorant receptor 131-2-like n=1 Tax=Hippocampus zosterae TaxID=109293 RepID=UPI00223E012B|nr:odorant receptor 131-2-like [Hippocampus zosterae]
MQTTFLANATKLSLVERVTIATLTTSFCLMFLSVNALMLFVLRSKSVFRETSRYILLYNLLLADTLQLTFSQLMYLLAASRVTLSYPVCGVLSMLTSLLSRMSPLVLVVMSLERYVAVCHPLRHASIITVRNTTWAVLAVWAFCFLNNLIQGLLLITFPFRRLKSLQMTQPCTYGAMFLVPLSELYANIYTYFSFASASLIIVFSYVGVVVSARSAAADKHSVRKARNTLLMHLVQLGLSLLCLSSLIYGLRDQSLRVVLVYFCLPSPRRVRRS